MDFGKINTLVQEVEKRRRDGRHVDVETRKLIEEVRTRPFLDWLDASVYVQYPHMISPVWEHFDGVTDYTVDHGVLSVATGGNDSDGDWVTVGCSSYPDGAWLKFETSMKPVPNPYYEPAEEGTEVEA